MEEKSKLKYLNSLEIDRDTTPDVSKKQKFFVTFPIPYMNGRLHLGHLFSVSKADFFSYYKELQGYNVLFPFAFHCTGMPISASAKKLEEELNGKNVDLSVKNIIKDLGFEDARPFTDPVHWVRTFPELCIKSLKRFHSNIDWRRSFITTDINKYYDSFIKWQFNRLNELGYLSFGKRHSIFCPLDKQPCLDHDRRKGENVKPVGVVLCKLKFEDGILLARFKEGQIPSKVIIGRRSDFVGFEYNNTKYFAEKDIFENIDAQVDGVFRKESVTGDFFSEKNFECFGEKIKGDCIERDVPCIAKGVPDKKDSDLSKYIKKEMEFIGKIENTESHLAETKDLLKFYEPEEEVISRSGGKCIVALTDQWYIDYDDSEWKKKVRECIANIVCTDDTRAILESAVEWIGKWGFSRSFGLGTRVPWENEYLIDSLSDSTIYMAMYTFKHFLYKDLEGKEEIFPSSKLSSDVWNYIFLNQGIKEDLLPFEEILSNCRKSFNYFYPVDLRVSGKDLLKNHLIFFLFNHVALFEKKHWPRRIFTNGYLMLNSEKMSKSSGNFLTVDESLAKFGVSSTRMCLAVCGDTNEDANFVESNANAFTLKLYSYVKMIEELCIGKNFNPCILKLMKDYESMGFADKFLLQAISMNISHAIRAHEDMVYRDVVKYGFYEMIHAKEMYHILKGTNEEIVFLLYKTMTQLLYPIIPSLARHLIETYFHSSFLLPVPFLADTSEVDGVLHLKNTLKRLVVQKKKKKCETVEILVGMEYSEWKRRCMGIVDQIACECKILNINISEEIKRNESPLPSKIIEAVREVLKGFGVPEKKGILFSMDYLNHPENYSMKFNEYEVLKSYKHYIEDNTGLEVIICVSPRADPGTPLFEFK
ncbi:leucyl-tRNA synthetase [Encephalitozoon intestinalis ATCC 50506]|uniref:leucine--tRNA ligase n=1 Tax=Encephalitozoon intestinalis (strain ATCC 50506) TaxID=876142 RepID=E0S7E8_ENCIT|nr:leucyl-tRNA synthetase [Encephalitozoon intestinalis ATCC 50506]ADM11627.1 leucyl-tRNA synthetase [Encephalitozoon intestinalis ATCC 50506]UTX45358.1 leucyl-tRNA synthetase [Encephalitozoon intestinalis]